MRNAFSTLPKQFSHVNLSQLSAQTSTLHVKKGRLRRLRINSVTIVRNLVSSWSFSGAVQLISSVFGYIYVSYVQVMYSRWKTQTGEGSSKETSIRFPC